MNRQRSFLTSALLIWSLLPFKQAASAQTAQVTGIITDANSAVIAGVQLRLTIVDTSVARKAVTTSDGYYSIPFVPRGNYQLNVLADGFKPVTRNNLSINVDQASRNDFTLEIGVINESVITTGGGPPLERQNSSIGHVIENKSIVTLPLNGRNYSQLALLIPGPTPDQLPRAADGFNINGNRALQNKFLVDGLDNNNYIMGVDTGSTQAIRPSVDAIQEFKVESANYSAQYGQAAGGIISVALKSGTNSFHGSVFEFLRNDTLDANDFFANRAGPERRQLRFNQFGGALGGPLLRNRTVFFARFQGPRNPNSNSSAVTGPN